MLRKSTLALITTSVDAYYLARVLDSSSFAKKLGFMSFGENDLLFQHCQDMWDQSHKLKTKKLIGTRVW